MCTGLFPFPPRTELEASHSELTTLAGVLVESVLFHSRPDWPVPCLKFSRGGVGPMVVFLCGVWNNGKAHPAAQALGISLALAGYQVLILEPPGRWSESALTERVALGDAWDASLQIASPALGGYVWDCLRAIDWLDSNEVALIGHGLGAEAAMLATSLDDRVKCAVISGAGGSYEALGNISDSWLTLPGIAQLGDVADIFSPQKPSLFLCAENDPLHPYSTVERTVTKLNKGRKSDLARIECFAGPADLNRRMRETAVEFLDEVMRGATPSAYVYEAIPLTDGFQRTASAGTTEPELLAVLGDASESSAFYGGAQTRTFTELNEQTVAEPYPEIEISLIPWLKYGRLKEIGPADEILLSDGPGSPSAVVLPIAGLDMQLLCAVGLSSAEFYAQLLHLSLPGSPTGWAEAGLTGDPFTAMIASVKTLVSGGSSDAVKLIRAEGALASLAAQALKRYRPDVEISVSHPSLSWAEARAACPEGGSQPGSRYRKF